MQKLVEVVGKRGYVSEVEGGFKVAMLKDSKVVVAEMRAAGFAVTTKDFSNVVMVAA